MAREKRQLGLQALELAIRRAHEAQAKGDEISFFAPVAEAVWWLTMLDETLWGTEHDDASYKSVRCSSRGGVLLLGLRYARNRQVHDTQVTGMQGNPLLGQDDTPGDPWRWRSLDAPGVPTYEPKEGRWGKKGEQAYCDLMVTHEVLPTLEEAVRFLDSWIEKLHPELRPQRDTR